MMGVDWMGFVVASDAMLEGNQSAAGKPGKEGHFMLITDNNAKAKKVLSEMGAEVKVEDVVAVEVPNRIGQLQQIAQRISDAGIDISYIYGSPVKSNMTLIVKTADDRNVLKVLAK